MTKKYLEWRAKHVIRNIKEDRIYNMADHEYDTKRLKKDGRSRVA